MKKPKSKLEKIVVATIIILALIGCFFFFNSAPVIKYLSDKP